jgi:hypothetical protein
MTRVKPNQPFTLAEYKTLDSAGKKENLFIRVLERLKATEETLRGAQNAVLEANRKLETSNAKAFAGNEEMSTLKQQLSESKLQHEICKNLYADQVKTINEHRAELDRIKSKWYFKLFGAW